MYKPQGNFEAVRYGELYGNNPDATKREMRQNGRQFRRYLRSDVADRDRAMFEDMERSRAAGDIAMRSNMGAAALAAGFDRSIPIDTEGAMSRMQAGEEASAARSAELAAQDLNNRIAGAARFNDAFRMARQAGLKTFKWKGGVYGTQMAGEVAPITPAPTPTSASASAPASAPRTPAPAPASTTAPASAPSINSGQPLSDAEIAQWAAKQSWSRDDWARLSAEDRQKIAQRRREDSRKRAEEAKAQELAGARTVFDNQFQDLVMFKDRGKGVLTMADSGTPTRYDVRSYNNVPYAYDPNTGLVRRMYTNSWSDNPVPTQWYFGNATFGFADDSKWVTPNHIVNFDNWEAEYIRNHPAPDAGVKGATTSGYRSPDEIAWAEEYAKAKRAAGYKQGGRFNRVNYFQQGGAVQQDAMAQVQALVQAAAQGDEQATQQITQIMEAAKAGDQQAMQIAQMIQQVVQQMQGQATSAKWGAKVNYIKSLKYAKGGKTCPTCEK